MNQGAKYTICVAAVLFGAAVFPLLAVAASLILVGMALHSCLSSTGESPLPRQVHLEQQRTEQLIHEARRRLDHEL